MDDEIIFTSPFFEYSNNTVLGGDITTTDNVFLIILIVVLIIAIIWILVVVIRKIKVSGEDYNQRQAHLHFNNVRGEDFDDEARLAIRYGEAIENPRAIDHYRVGTVQLINAGNRVAAWHHFNQALDQIIHGYVNTREAPFIIDRIGDFNDQFIDMPDIDDLPLQQAMEAQYRHQFDQLKNVTTKKKIIIDRDDPEFIQKTILSRQDWQSDSQNVHDSAIYEILKDQILAVIKENKSIPGIQIHNYDEAVSWLRNKFKNDPKLISVNEVIHTIDDNNPVSSIPGVYEKEIITAVWQRSFDPANVKNQLQIRNALADAVYDCVERGHVVCMSGRSSKVWQALARLDKNENIGVLKSKQVLRNEIYQRSAKVVDDFVGPNGSASVELKNAYNKDEDTEQVRELIECIKRQIEAIANEYKDIFSADQIDSIIQECIAVV